MFPRDIVCLRDISINTQHKGDGDGDDDDDDDDDDDNNNNNNNNSIVLLQFLRAFTHVHLDIRNQMQY